MELTENRKKRWTVLDVLDWTSSYLEQKNFENPRLNVEWLLSHTLSCKRFDLYVQYDRPLNITELDNFKKLLQRRLEFEPLQYITGSTEFVGLSLLVDSNVLIPRPDTEMLVERALHTIAGFNLNDSVKILDIGTGSGAIAIALAKFLSERGLSSSITALDSNPKALEVAKLNEARILKRELIRFVHGDIFSTNIVEELSEAYNVIISNPPYITPQDYEQLPDEIRLFEPREALEAEEDGLACFRRIVELAPQMLGKNLGASLIFEVGHNQSNSVAELLESNSFREIQVHRDLNQVERIVEGVYADE